MLHVQSSPMSRIVTPFDVVEDIGPGFGSCPIVLPIHTFAFEYLEEALSGGGSHDPVMVGMQHTDPLPDILLRSRTRRAGHPAIVPAGRDPQTSGTSSGWETRCGTVGSSDTSSRRAREERCRFSQKIPLLRYAG